MKKSKIIVITALLIVCTMIMSGCFVSANKIAAAKEQAFPPAQEEQEEPEAPPVQEEQEAEVNEEPSEDSSASDSGDGVPTVDTIGWREWLTQYEKWVDRYVVVLEKMQKNPADTAGWLDDYTRMMVEATEWQELAEDAMSDLSGADYTEFFERWTKIIEKLSSAVETA